MEEQVVYSQAPAGTFNWAPVAALIALPAAVAAFLLRKGEQQLELPLHKAKIATAGLAASAVMASGAMMPMPAAAAGVIGLNISNFYTHSPIDISGLTPCAESKKFQKNLKKEVKALEKREKLYEAGSAPYLALEATKVSSFLLI
jgi:hypothetical protein